MTKKINRARGKRHPAYSHGDNLDGLVTTEYRSWASMKQRCSNPKNNRYYLYGGRGIAVCKRWLNFKYFLKDMGRKPDGTSLERIDGSKGYSPANCRWATDKEQSNNTSRNRKVTLHGISKTVATWCDEKKLNYRTIRARIFEYGWTPEQAFSTPIAKYSCSSLPKV